MDQYYQEIEKWRKTADANLRNENSWLALAGLFWLEEGENKFGTDRSNNIILPSGPARMGSFFLKDDQVTVHIEDEINIQVDGENIKEAQLKPDVTGAPTEITFEDLTMMLIEREDGLGIRLWDNQQPERKNFAGRIWFPIDVKYLVKGSYQPFDEDLDLVMQRKNGSDFQDQAQGQIIFQLDGQDLCLIVFEQENGALFTLFLDQTSGKDSYPAGRYLVIGPPLEGLIEIDFNYSYNPPCAFSDFATCPLPPAQNRLDIAIRAGEKL